MMFCAQIKSKTSVFFLFSPGQLIERLSENMFIYKQKEKCQML